MSIKVIKRKLHRLVILHFKHDPTPPKTSAPILTAGTAATSLKEALAQTQNGKILQDFFIWAPFCASLTEM